MVGMLIQSYSHNIHDTINQGKDPICAACSSAVFLNWNYNKNFNYYNIYESAGGRDNGLSFKDILHYLRQKGLIKEYALVHSEQALKTAILVNGPCLGAMTVRNSKRSNFWDGERIEGLHGIAVIGWNDKGFIIKNSWGNNWGHQGNTVLPYDRFSEFLELWTMIA